VNLSRPTARAVTEHFGGAVRDALDLRCAIGRMNVKIDTEAPDSMAKIIVRDTADRPVACVLCSHPLAPKAAARSMARAREARTAMGPDLGQVILEPLDEGEIDGLSFAILPFRMPLDQSRLTSFVFRSLASPSIFSWLRRVTDATIREPTADQVQLDFIDPLRELSAHHDVPASLRAAADSALGRLEGGQWRPRQVLMHGDLWEGNILIDHAPGARLNGSAGPGKKSGLGFVVIDWETLKVRGYAIYDLIRAAESFRISSVKLAAEIASHCRVLECDRKDARSYLVAALGHQFLTREHMPIALYQQMVSSCLDTLAAITD
jgi:hypothetical protein